MADIETTPDSRRAIAWHVSTIEIAQTFKTSTATIGKWVLAGMPKENKSIFDFRKAFAWWLEHIYANKDDKDQTEAKARRDYWVEKAKNLKVKNEMVCKTLIDADKVYGEFAARAQDLRTSLRSLKNRLAPVLEGKSREEIAQEIGVEMDKILSNYCRIGKFIEKLPDEIVAGLPKPTMKNTKPKKEKPEPVVAAKRPSKKKGKK